MTDLLCHIYKMEDSEHHRTYCLLLTLHQDTPNLLHSEKLLKTYIHIILIEEGAPTIRKIHIHNTTLLHREK